MMLMFDVTVRSFINNVISFFLLTVSLYIIALIYGRVSKDSIVKEQVKCKYCRKSISPKVRVSRLNSGLDGSWREWVCGLEIMVD